MTSSKSGEGSGANGGNGTNASENNENDESENKSTDCNDSDTSKKILILKSPMSCTPAQYSWPLKKGKGSLRRSEDKEDEAGEIIETIRWVGEDAPEIKLAIENAGPFSQYDPKSYDSMLSLCKTYNKAVDKYLKDRETLDQTSKLTRCSKLHLKHILQKCYNKSVIDPNELNNYEAFTPEVYGETSFELICQILDKLHPIGSENKFVDLGSGVGQVVLQVAALTNCSMSLGIEKANTPAKYAEELQKWFEFWMKFYGKVYSPYMLMKGNFLDSRHRVKILQSTIMFANNILYGPKIDQSLKEIFADAPNGVRIFSSKSFCATNFRTNNRNLSDIGTIMHVSKMDPLKGSVSWTGRPVSYYLHVIDRAKLERYFQKTAARKGEKSSKRGGGVWTDASRGPSEDDAETASSPGGIHGRPIVSDKKNLPHRRFGLLAKHKGKRVKRNLKKSFKKRQTIADKESSFDDYMTNHAAILQRVHEDNEYETAGIATPPTDSNSSSPPHQSLDHSTPTPNRPMRAVVANAAAISEAQHDNPTIKKRGRKRMQLNASELSSKNTLNSVVPSNVNGNEDRKLPNFKKNLKSLSKISGLDLLHQTTMDSINASEVDSTVPQGCVYERLTKNAPNKLIHEELPLSLNVEQNNHTQLPFGLQAHLEKCKRQYLNFMRHMENPILKHRISIEMIQEKRKNEYLQKRERTSKEHLDLLIRDSLIMLRQKLINNGIRSKSIQEYFEKATSNICNDKTIKMNQTNLRKLTTQISDQQDINIRQKQTELLERTWHAGITSKKAKEIMDRSIHSALKCLNYDDKLLYDPILKDIDKTSSDVVMKSNQQSCSSTKAASKRQYDNQCTRYKFLAVKKRKIDSSRTMENQKKPNYFPKTTKEDSLHFDIEKMSIKNPTLESEKNINELSPSKSKDQTTRIQMVDPNKRSNILKRITDHNSEGKFWKFSDIL